jgi:histidyl-tRNA synthetase
MELIQKIKGFQDLIAEEADTYTFIEDTARQTFARYGFAEIRIPIVEKTDLFARSIGDETDIVQKEMYTFPDRKGRSLTLRPEATAGVVRAYIENKLYSGDAVSKWFTCGPMFRYERPQKGRLRQFHQVNCELLGTGAAQADAEVILMLWTFLGELGLQKLSIEINTLGCPKCREGYHRALQDFLAQAGEEDLCPDCQRRKTTNPLRVLDCKVPACRQKVEHAPRTIDHVCQDCLTHFQAVLTQLEALEVPYAMNHRLVRGLDYYQRTTFEVVSMDIGAQSSVAGGGRYDGLVRDLGGPDVPGIGFACGMERLAMILGQVRSRHLDFYLAVIDASALTRGQVLGQHLRERGLSGLVSFEPRSLKSQLRQANKQGARSCLIMGRDELDTETILLKDMESGEQSSLSQDEIEKALLAVRKSPPASTNLSA